MGLSSAAFAADAVSTTQAPAATHSTAAKTTHHKNTTKPRQNRPQSRKLRLPKHKKQKLNQPLLRKPRPLKTQKVAAKPAAPQKAQAAKKHHKAAAKPAAQKAQAAKNTTKPLNTRPLNRLHSRQHNSSRRTNLLNNRRCFSAVFLRALCCGAIVLSSS
ncbi:acid resistance repetitive basic protein Asr [Klebsiella pneumoniae]|nr:acid resistance repetitive basic protein Asr [Klebsiella pneumoniae]